MSRKFELSTVSLSPFRNSTTAEGPCIITAGIDGRDPRVCSWLNPSRFLAESWKRQQRVIVSLDLDLDLDSSRIQLDALGHTPTPSVSVKSCHLASSQVNPIFADYAPPVRSWSTWFSLVSWYLPVQCLLWSIRKTCPSQPSRLSLSMLSMVCCPVLVLTAILVILSFHKMPSILLCHLWCAASRLFVNATTATWLAYYPVNSNDP